MVIRNKTLIELKAAIILIVGLLLTSSCQETDRKPKDQTNQGQDTTLVDTSTTNGENLSIEKGKTYSNERFREVKVERTGQDEYRIWGEAQIFEASFGWVVEDGHNEIKEGFTTADMGAPEWGNFDFTIQVEKARPNSTLILVLYETSMKDGSRQHELPIPLG